MQMMFFYILSLIIFYTINIVESTKQNLKFDDDIFYGDPSSLEKIQLDKLKEQYNNDILKPFNPKIKKLNDYLNNNNSMLSKKTNYLIKEDGQCVNFSSFKNLFSNNKNKKEIEDNLNSISNYLNDVNYIFKDEYGNLLVYSVCRSFSFISNGSNTIDNDNYSNCFQKLIFISKIDFSYYNFSFTGEKVPGINDFSIDFSFDEISHKRYFFLFGGIDDKGNHNSDIYRFDINYIFGNIKVNKLTSSDVNSIKNKFAPQGLSDMSYNVVQYMKENLNNNKNFLSIIFGGNNDENISNNLHVFKHDTLTWLSHNYIRDKKILPRKGHSAMVVNRNILQENSMNKKNNNTFNIIVFGGKSENAYLNDIIIIKIDYITLIDKVNLKYLQLENNRDIIGDFPEPREGHTSFIENDNLIIYGGCNFYIKKCYYDSLYKLNLKQNPFRWKKVKINYHLQKEGLISEKIKFNDFKTGNKISNFLPFNNFHFSIGICEKKDDFCKNEINVLINNSPCSDEKLYDNNNCFLEPRDTNNHFDWIYQCEKKNKKIEFKQNNNIEKKDNDDTNHENYKKEKKIISSSNFTFNESKNNTINDINYLNSFLQVLKPEIYQKSQFSDLIDNKNHDLVNLNEKLLTENLLKLLKELSLSKQEKKNQKKKINNIKYIERKNLYDEQTRFSNENINVTKINNKFKNITKKKNLNILNKHKHLNEKESLNGIGHKISDELRNITIKLEESFNNKFEYYINNTLEKTIISNKNLENIIKDKFMQIQNENSHLKKLVFISEIKPMLADNIISNTSINEINFLNFEEKIIDLTKRIKNNITDKFKEKALNELKENSDLTKKLQRNITEIKSILNKDKIESRKNLDKLLDKLINKIQSIDTIIETNLKNITQFINKQEKINNSTKDFFIEEEFRRKKNKKQCFNGFLLNETYCQCLPGFSGENCERVLICEDECSKNGVCHYGKCFCNPGFSGSKCESKEKCQSDCYNRGKCHLGKCYCDYGFSGPICEKKLSCKNDCSNKGICYRGKCLCEPGWSGEDCSVLAVKFNICKNNCNRNGICKMEKCFCYPGFSGKFCEIKNKFACPFNMNVLNNTSDNENKTNVPCNGNGLCKYGMCFCYPGFKGKACEKKETCKNDCNNNGLCINGKCKCKNNLKTEDCSESLFKNLINNLENRKLNNDTIKIKNKEFYDIHFKQIENQNFNWNKSIDNTLHSKNGFISGKENKLKFNSIDKSNREDEEKKLQNNIYFIDNKKGKFNNIAEGIYVGKETVDKIMSLSMILLLLVCFIILILCFNKKLSK